MPPSRRFRLGRRRGIALLAALALMALVALLIVGGLASSILAQRSSRATHSDALLSAAADYALNTVLADPRGFGLADLPFGEPRSFGIPTPDADGVNVQLSATRLRGGVVWLVADASLAGLDQGERRVNLVVRFPAVGPAPGAGIIARGPVSLGKDVAFQSDTAREAGCGDPAVSDIILPPGVAGVGTDSVRVAHLPRASDSVTYYLTDSQLAGLNGASNVVHARGDTTISGGAFTGVLVIDGGLTVTGPFTINGLLVVRGRVDARGGGFAITGALLSFAAPPTGLAAIDLAAATIRYSGCTVERVLRTATLPRPVRQRSWAELF